MDLILSGQEKIMKFKVGNEVEVIRGEHRGEIGFIVDTVICLTEDREYHSISKSEDGLPGCCVSEDSIELIPVRRRKAQFKIGDKVKIYIKDYDVHLEKFNNQVATIINTGCDDEYWDLEWENFSISEDWHQSFFVHFSEPVKQARFKVKDRVAINLIRMPEWNGAKGYIEKAVNDHSYKVMLDGNSTAIQFHSSQLDRLPNVVPQSNPQFCVGDKVETIYGMGIVSEANFSIDTDWMYRVVLDNGRSMTFAPMGLKFMAKSQFVTGDKVRIIEKQLLLYGNVGTINSVNNGSCSCDMCYQVKWKNGNCNIFEEKCLELVEFKIGDKVKVHGYYGRVTAFYEDGDLAEVKIDDCHNSYPWINVPIEDIKLVSQNIIRGEGSKNISMGHKPNKIQCKMCGGTGKLLMLNNYVSCDCVKNED